MQNPKRNWRLYLAGAYTGFLTISFLVMLQLPSGYSTSFLGLSTPSNPEEFRRHIGTVVVGLLVASTAIGIFAAWRATRSRSSRIAAVVPAVLGTVLLVALLYNAHINAIA